MCVSECRSILKYLCRFNRIAFGSRNQAEDDLRCSICGTIMNLIYFNSKAQAEPNRALGPNTKRVTDPAAGRARIHKL